MVKALSLWCGCAPNPTCEGRTKAALSVPPVVPGAATFCGISCHLKKNRLNCKEQVKISGASLISQTQNLIIFCLWSNISLCRDIYFLVVVYLSLLLCDLSYCHKSHLIQKFTRKNAGPQELGPHFVMCASLRTRNAHQHITRTILYRNLLKKGRATRARHTHFAGACAIEMHLQSLLYGNLHGKMPGPRSGTQTLCEPAQSKCTSNTSTCHKMLRVRLNHDQNVDLKPRQGIAAYQH